MSDPITAAAIGAGISGGSSLLRGKSLGSSLQNAAIGGALGGAGGYLGGAMGGAGGATSNAANTATQNATSQGMFDVATGSTLGGQGPATFAGGGGYDPSFLGRLREGIGNPFADLTARDKLGLGLQTAALVNQSQSQPQMQPPQLGVIRPQQTGQYQPTLQARIPQLPRRQTLLG